MGIFTKRHGVTSSQHRDSDVTATSDAHDIEKKVIETKETQDNLRAGALSQDEIPINPEVEKRMRRKVDLRVTFLLAFLFLLSFLDRSNIGNARIAGMSTDLKLSSDDYDWLLTIFYISYIVFQIQGFMWRIVKPHNWAFFIVLFWGIVSTCQAATQNWGGMMALRFLLGLAESGFGPSVPFLLSFFYLRHEVGFRCGLFLSAAPLANTFAGALAYGITSGHSKLANWRLLFLVEGLPTICASFLAWYILPDGPNDARFLDEEEQEVARLRTIKQHGKKDEENTRSGINIKDIGLTLLDAKAWFTALMYFSCNVSYSSLPVFLPTILNEMGFTKITAQGLSAPPYFVAFLVTILSSYIADRTQQRALVIISLSLIGGTGYILLSTTTSVAARYAGVFLAASGVFPSIANILPWVINNQGTATRRGMGIVLLNVIGQCGPLLGTRVFPSSQGPRYIEGQSICAAFMFFNAALALGLRTLLRWENGRLERRWGGSGGGQGQVMDEADDGGDENYGRKFRYVL